MGEGYYGRRYVGLATPQANPTAETEFGHCCQRCRLRDGAHGQWAPDPEARLRAYFIDIADTLNRFDTLAMQAVVGLQCSGYSSAMMRRRILR